MRNGSIEWRLPVPPNQGAARCLVCIKLVYFKCCLYVCKRVLPWLEASHWYVGQSSISAARWNSGRGSKQRQQRQRVETAVAKRRTLVVAECRGCVVLRHARPWCVWPIACLYSKCQMWTKYINKNGITFRHYRYAASMNGAVIGVLSCFFQKSASQQNIVKLMLKGRCHEIFDTFLFVGPRKNGFAKPCIFYYACTVSA